MLGGDWAWSGRVVLPLTPRSPCSGLCLLACPCKLGEGAPGPRPTPAYGSDCGTLSFTPGPSVLAQGTNELLSLPKRSRTIEEAAHSSPLPSPPLLFPSLPSPPLLFPLLPSPPFHFPPLPSPFLTPFPLLSFPLLSSVPPLWEVLPQQGLRIW